MTITDVVNVDQQPDMINAGINLLDMGHVVVVTKSNMLTLKLDVLKAMISVLVQNSTADADIELIRKTIAY